MILFFQRLWSWWFGYSRPIPYWLGTDPAQAAPIGWEKQWVTDGNNRQYVVYRPHDPEDGKWT